MTGFVPLSARVPYTTAQIRILFGHSDGRGSVIPLCEETISRWRKRGFIPFIKINGRTFRYPREKIDDILAARSVDAEEMCA